MAKLPLPERGQPLDVTYIYQIVDVVNDLATQVSSTSSNYTTIDSGTAGKQNIKTSAAKIVAGYVQVVNNQNVNVTEIQTFEYNFGGDFKFPPTVTATLVNITGTPAGTNATVVLTKVESNRVFGSVKFNTAGIASVGVNIIAIGISN
jgi:hypothetical protein